MKKIDYEIGQIIGNFTVIDNNRINSKIKVKCVCANEFYIDPYRLKSTNTCRECRHGNYPGKIIEGCTLIESIGRGKWKIKCRCEKIYECIPRSDIRSFGSRFRDCGCTRNKTYFERAKKKIGFKFGQLKVIELKKGNRHNILICKCKCGNIIEIENGHELKQNSCGCLKKKNVPKGENKGNSRFTNSEILAMREFHKDKVYDSKELANIFDISENYLCRIVNGHIWKSVK